MSKQVNRVNIEPEILQGNWSSYMKYNFLLTLLLLVKLTISIHYIMLDHPAIPIYTVLPYCVIMQAIPIQCRSWLKK